jgi:hypothetical protein
MEKIIRCIESWKTRQNEWLHHKLDGLPPQKRLTVVLIAFIGFALCAIFMLGTALYQIGRNDGQQIRIDHIKQIDLRTKHDSINSNNNYETKSSKSDSFHTKKT